MASFEPFAPGTTLEFANPVDGTCLKVTLGLLLREGAAGKADIYSASIGGAEGVPLIVKAAGRLFPNGALSHLQLYRLSKEENIGFNVADRPGLVGFLGASHGNSKYHSLWLMPAYIPLSSVASYLDPSRPVALFRELLDAVATPLSSLSEVIQIQGRQTLHLHQADASFYNLFVDLFGPAILLLGDWSEADYIPEAGSVSPPSAFTPGFEAPENSKFSHTKADLFSVVLACLYTAFNSRAIPEKSARATFIREKINLILESDHVLGTIALRCLDPDVRTRYGPQELMEALNGYKSSHGSYDQRLDLFLALRKAVDKRNTSLLAAASVAVPTQPHTRHVVAPVAIQQSHFLDEDPWFSVFEQTFRTHLGNSEIPAAEAIDLDVETFNTPSKRSKKDESSNNSNNVAFPRFLMEASKGPAVLANAIIEWLKMILSTYNAEAWAVRLDESFALKIPSTQGEAKITPASLKETLNNESFLSVMTGILTASNGKTIQSGSLRDVFLSLGQRYAEPGTTGLRVLIAMGIIDIHAQK